MGAYAETFRRSLDDKDGFWAEAAKAIDWVKPPTVVLDDSRAPFVSWFPDGELNTCHNALDRHVAGGRADQLALIYDSPVTGTQRRYTYRELLEQVSRFAGVLRAEGVQRGDRVVLYMPMVPEAIVAMLACARLGAVHSVVFGGFAPRELADRINDAQPVVIVAASCGIEPTRVVEYKPMLDAAIDMAEHKPSRCVILQREQATATMNDCDVDWNEAMAAAEPVAECVRGRRDRSALHPLHLRHDRAAQGHRARQRRSRRRVAVEHRQRLRPEARRGVVDGLRRRLGRRAFLHRLRAAAARRHHDHVRGQAGGDAGRRGVLAGHRRARRGRRCSPRPPSSGPSRRRTRRRNSSPSTTSRCLRNLFLAGERLDPDTYHWATDKAGVPVIDHWWQTETGWPIVANLRGLEPMPIKAGSPSVPVPGWDVQVLDGSGKRCAPGEEGAICVRLPLPPGALPTLWQDDERFVSSYLAAFDGWYSSGDGGYVDEDGYVYVLGRTDDVINVAGHRLSTGTMEAVLAQHPAVAECAVIGVEDDLKGQVPRGFVVLKAGVATDPAQVCAELVAAVRAEIGAVAAFKRADVVPALPKTRSGKILRKTMRGIADGRNEPIPSTIEDATVLDKLRPILLDKG